MQREIVRHTNDLVGARSGSRGATGAVGVEAARAAARLAKQVEVALVGVELSLPQYRALAFLSSLASGRAAPSDLAGQLAVSKPTITALVDGLVARGYVARTPDPDDRRRVTHEITPEGERALAAADAAVAERLGQLARHLDPDDAEAAACGLATWGAALDAARAEARDAARRRAAGSRRAGAPA